MSDTDFERLNILLAVRDREFAKALDRNTRKIDRFGKQSARSMSKATRSFDALGMAAKRLGPLLTAAAGAAMVAKLNRTVSALDDIGKTADKIGITTDALQELRAVAESAGIAQGSLDSSLERFSKRLGEASLGMGAAKRTLDELGLSADALIEMGLDEALSVVADHMAAIPDPTTRAARAAALFGREGVAMVNLMREGSDGMEQMRAEARELGIVIDEDLIRNAEGAQTQLDLMSRVISAQLNSALINLAPLLVGGATAIADFARMMGSAATAVRDFINPQTALDLATENLVTALGDEIIQTQVLNAALHNGVNLSEDVARQKLEEARSRHENVKAIIAEHRALVLQSDEWGDLTRQIEESNAALDSLGFRHNDHATFMNAEAFEAEQLRLVGLIQQRNALLKTDKAMDEQLAQTAENIAALEYGLDNMQSGRVVLGDFIAPIENSINQDVPDVAAGSDEAIPALEDYQDVINRVREAFEGTQVEGENYLEMLARLQELHESGELSAEDYRASLGLIGDELEQVMSTADTLEGEFEGFFASIIKNSDDAGDAIANLSGRLADMALDAAFSGMFSGPAMALAPIFSPGVGGGLGGFFGGGLPSFDGGGHTGNAPRSGGLDGKGGFLAMLHPQEGVVDYTKGGTAPASSGGGDTIVINQYGLTGNEEIAEMTRQGVSEGLAQFDRHVLPARVNEISADPKRVS